MQSACNQSQSACDEGGNQHAISMRSACNQHAISRGVPCQPQPGRICLGSSRAPPSNVPVGKGEGAVVSTCMLSRTTSARTAPAPMREAISMQSACNHHTISMDSACTQHGLSMHSARVLLLLRLRWEREACGRRRGSGRRGEHVHAPRSGHQRSSVVISGHQRSSAVLSGHQRSSAVISGH